MDRPALPMESAEWRNPFKFLYALSRSLSSEAINSVRPPCVRSSTADKTLHFSKDIFTISKKTCFSSRRERGHCQKPMVKCTTKMNFLGMPRRMDASKMNFLGMSRRMDASKTNFFGMSRRMDTPLLLPPPSSLLPSPFFLLPPLSSAVLLFPLICSLVGCLVGKLVCWLVGWLLGWLVGRLVGWLAV